MNKQEAYSLSTVATFLFWITIPSLPPLPGIHFPSFPNQNPPIYCPLSYAPVCGINGKTYGNSCEATQQNHMPIAYMGSCDHPFVPMPTPIPLTAPVIYLPGLGFPPPPSPAIPDNAYWPYCQGQGFYCAK